MNDIIASIAATGRVTVAGAPEGVDALVLARRALAGPVLHVARDDARMARVLAAWDAHLVHRGLPRALPELLRQAGFEVVAVRVVPLLNVGYDPETYSGGIRDLIAEFVTGQGVPADDVAAWRDDLLSLGDRSFFSLNRYLFVAVRP